MIGTLINVGLVALGLLGIVWAVFLGGAALFEIGRWLNRPRDD